VEYYLVPISAHICERRESCSRLGHKRGMALLDDEGAYVRRYVIVSAAVKTGIAQSVSGADSTSSPHPAERGAQMLLYNNNKMERIEEKTIPLYPDNKSYILPGNLRLRDR